MLALLPMCLKENQEECLTCVRLVLLAADFGVLPAVNSPSVDLMLELTACVRGDQKWFKFCHLCICLCTIYLLRYLEGFLTCYDTA